MKNITEEIKRSHIERNGNVITFKNMGKEFTYDFKSGMTIIPDTVLFNNEQMKYIFDIIMYFKSLTYKELYSIFDKEEHTNKQYEATLV